MAAWASLSGYLYFKPTGGALSRLKSKKRLWCVLDESKGQLVYHKSEEDARCKPPLGQIELSAAAITLDLDNQNQFVIIVDGKETYLTAENHESMMIWLMALQAKRDHFAKYESSDRAGDATYDGRGAPFTSTLFNPDAHEMDHQRERSSSDVSVVREGGGDGHRSLCATKSLHSTPLHLRPDLQTAAVQLRRQQLRRLGESFDGGQSPKVEGWARIFQRRQSHVEVTGSTFFPFNRQLSISMESSELLRQQPQQQHSSRYLSNGPIPSSSHGTNINFSLPATSSARMQQETSSSGSTVDSDDICGEERGKHHMFSSLSASSADSAIDKGDNCDLVSRVHELEKELISSKCELAKVMNRQTCYTEILKQKDEIILDLDEKLGRLGGVDTGYDSKKRSVQASKDLQERIRILQNQNRFLNEEVRRLARLRSQEQSKIRDQEGQVHSLEGDIEVWKLQYVSLIQSSIRFTGTDTMDDAELSLYGGDRHKNKVKSLLDEARKINPSLPTYENLAAGEVHVDYYGFKHQFHDAGLLLHYLCQELTQHYLSQAATAEKHQQEWHQYFRSNAKSLMKNSVELKHLCRAGIPDCFRRTMWRCFIHDKVSDVMVEKGPHYYRSLCSMLPDSPLAARYRKQISLDLMRTMPSNIKFSTQGSKGIMDLQDVLLAFCVHNPNIGYCQGMNFLVAMALLFLDAQDAFWTLVAVTERYHSISYFDQNLLGAQADQSVLRDLLGDVLPDLARHLEAIDIEISTVTLNWFLAIFFDAVPFPTLLRVWDCFLLEGPKVLFRFSMAILKLHEREIVHKTETISVMRHLKACARVTYDVDGLVNVAFKGFKNFPRRQDITSKQMVYLKALKEKYRWRELQKLAFAERENLFLSLESETSETLTFECCAVSTSGQVWVCYGHQTQSRACVVDCKEGTMTDLTINLSSRVMSLCAIEDGMLFGTLAWNIICYSETDRTFKWEQQLHDAVLYLCQFEDSSGCRVFAGLADGTVAVLENVSTDTTFYDVMYIMIGQSPVTCLRLVDSRLWCACGNTVSIIQASTLDALDSFSVSSNPYDHILSLQPGLPGVWIAVRGSSILELWDPETLCCKMLYDTRAGRYPNLRKDDDTYFNKARITCILPLDLSVWVGTGEGNLITYDVFTHNGSKTPSDSSSFVGSYSEAFSACIGSKEEQQPPSGEDYDPVREAAVRVRQLYLSQQQQQQDSDDDHVRATCIVPSSTSTLVNSSESVSFHPASDPQTTTTTIATAAPATSDEDHQEGGHDRGRRNTMLATPKAGLQRPDSIHTPGEEDNDGITPTTSFCRQDSTYSSATDLGVGGDYSPTQESKTLVEDPQAANEASRETTERSDTKEDVAHDHISDQTNAAFSKDASSNQAPSHREHEKGSSLRSPPSSINGVSKFYIGDEKQDKKKPVKNESVSAGADNEHSNKKDSQKKEVSIVAEKNWNNSESKKELVSALPASQACFDKNHSAKQAEQKGSTKRAGDGETESQESKTLSALPDATSRRSERTTSESGIEVAISDGSVIMQVWDGITKSRSNTRTSDDTIEEDGDVQPPQTSSVVHVDAATSEGAATNRKHTLKSVGSSHTSSVDSRHSESDEVFQDATDDFVYASTKDGARLPLTAPSSTVEESQYETGADDGTSPYETGQDDATSQDEVSHDRMSTGDSFHSLDKEGESTDEVSKSQDERSKARKKRPQSLFVQRGSNKNLAGIFVDRKAVEKPATRAPGLNLAVTSPTFSHPVANNISVHTMTATTTTTSKPIIITSDGAGSMPKGLRHRAGSDSSVADNLQPADPEAQYRLDYTNLHIDSLSDMDSNTEDGSIYSRRSSSVFTESIGTDSSKLGEDKEYEESDDCGDGRLRSLDCDPSSFIFPQDYYSLREGGDVVGRARMEFSSQMLQTPALSTISCRTWSSYDEVSSPSRGDCDSARSGRNSRLGSFGGGKGYLPRNNSQISTTISVASTAELLYAADMTLMSKNKISDKPVKCLLLYQFDAKPIVLSFSGCHTDDEAVLKWTREKDEMLWTNDPILEYNPATKTTKLPMYMKARLSSSSSTQSKQPRFSQGSQGSQ